MALADKVFASGSAEAGISNTKLRQEQMKSELGFTTLAGDVFALSKQIEDIIGDGNWKADVSGQSVQIVDLAAHLDGDKAAATLIVKKALEVTNGADLKSTLNVAGKADFAGIVDVATTLSASAIKIDGDAAAAGNLYLVGSEGQIVDSTSLNFDGSYLSMPAAKVTGLSPTHVVFVGAADELAESEHMTYSAGVLTVSGSTFSKNVGVAGNLTVQGNFVVEGDTVTQNVTTVTAEDSLITLNKNGLAIPAAGSGIEFEVGSAIVGYVKTNDVGDLLMQAATGGELTLDVSGNYEITVDGNLAVEAASAINQDVTTDAMPTFTKAKLSDLTATRLMASNADKETVSVATLSSWVAGTANQITVSDDGGVGTPDGTITLSLPQSIDLNADVEFDSLKLGDNVADAGKALKIGAAGEVVAAAWNEFIEIEANVGLELNQGVGALDKKAVIGLDQDIRKTASPEFAALNLGAYGDLLATGSDFKISAAAKLFSADGAFGSAAGGTWATGLALSKDAASWDALWTAFSMGSKGQLSLVEILTAAAPSNNKRLVLVKTIASAGPDFIVGAGDLAELPTGAAAYQGGKADIFVNGQKQVEGATADFEFAAAGGAGEKVKAAFKYNLQPGDVVELVRYPSASK